MKLVNSYRVRILGIMVFAILRLGLMSGEVMAGSYPGCWYWTTP